MARVAIGAAGRQEGAPPPAAGPPRRRAVPPVAACGGGSRRGRLPVAAAVTALAIPGAGLRVAAGAKAATKASAAEATPVETAAEAATATSAEGAAEEDPEGRVWRGARPSVRREVRPRSERARRAERRDPIHASHAPHRSSSRVRIEFFYRSSSPSGGYECASGSGRPRHDRWSRGHGARCYAASAAFPNAARSSMSASRVQRASAHCH